ncbi:hypothetical protein [Streptomyces sp. CNQ085]|uniref:hypothetical protein n=1 Tax=Streptomyces sp. CNQ085 TaxID=2886944 RepID=UPI001F50C4A0|nr:hypothetical protein [Streptomyces sp. CNQ085]MCI0383066.1 hypothetical protein [Streptomyces sp. CNQ085]
MGRLVRVSAVAAGLCCALFAAAPGATAASASPESGVQMCSEHINPGLLGGLFPSAGSQTKGCMTSSAAMAE